RRQERQEGKNQVSRSVRPGSNPLGLLGVLGVLAVRSRSVVMLQVSLARLKQGHRTIAYPAQAPTLPDRFRGLPAVDSSKCPDGCRACADACPTNAIAVEGGKVRLDL